MVLFLVANISNDLEFVRLTHTSGRVNYLLCIASLDDDRWSATTGYFLSHLRRKDHPLTQMVSTSALAFAQATITSYLLLGNGISIATL